jgi:hypothetical protein
MARTEIITVFIISFVSFLFLFSVSVYSSGMSCTPNPTTVGTLVTCSANGVGEKDRLSHFVWLDASKIMQHSSPNGTCITGGCSDQYTPGSAGLWNVSLVIDLDNSIVMSLLLNVTGGTTTTSSTTTTTILSTCTLSLNSSSINFGSLNPNDISNDQSLAVTSTGSVATTSFSIYGTDWDDGNGHTMIVGQTHWDTSGAVYGSMNTLLVSPGSTLTNLGASSSQIFHFKLQIPSGQTQGSYTQTITFTAGC